VRKEKKNSKSRRKAWRAARNSTGGDKVESQVEKRCGRD